MSGVFQITLYIFVYDNVIN